MDDVALTQDAIWRRYDAMEQRLTAPLSTRMLELARLAPGMSVLDLATGRGEPAIPAAHRVGDTGEVWCIEPEAAMLAMAQARAAREGLRNLHWLNTRAENPDKRMRDDFDVALCRWGLMYFHEPRAALRACFRALRPGGIFVAAVWAEPEQVSYHAFPRKVLADFYPVSTLDRGVPGAFYYADQTRLERDLADAGFHRIVNENFDTVVMEAASDQALIDWCRAFGMARELAQAPAAVHAHWEKALIARAGDYRENGVVRLGGMSRIVVAEKPV